MNIFEPGFRPPPEVDTGKFVNGLRIWLRADGLPVKAVHCTKDGTNPFAEKVHFRVELFGVEGQVREPLRGTLNIWDFQRVPQTTIDGLVQELENQYKKVFNPIPI